MAWRGSLSRSLMYTAKASGLRSSPLSSVPSGFSHSPLSAPRRLTFSNLRILGELGCVQSLMPLHSMVGVRFTSHLAVKLRTFCERSQGTFCRSCQDR